MKNFIPVLKRTQLFSGVGTEETESMLSCLNARLCVYQKGEYVIRQGEHLNEIIVLLEGNLHIQNDDYWGNRSILSHITPGEMYGESYVSPESGTVINDVVATEKSTVIFFNVTRILTTCSSACRFHQKVMQNMFFAISEKNRNLVQKLGHMSKRSTREKLVSYLSEQAGRQNNSHFTIPFNRQQLADFLSVDRSAMSNELCKMRDEGLIEFNKNSFILLDNLRNSTPSTV
ncbi:MAG: Crp/Fnr family transcriptional regulator [Clostridia bacterium]|nr:Crp/Fnr family transcriptional regulator [Clostridia bacterium]